MISNSNDCHLEKQLSSIGNILNKYLPSTRPPGGAAAIFKPAIFTESRKKRIGLRNMLSNILIQRTEKVIDPLEYLDNFGSYTFGIKTNMLRAITL